MAGEERINGVSRLAHVGQCPTKVMRIFRMGRPADPRIEVVNCSNNTPAMAAHSGDRHAGVFLIETTGGKITGINAIRAPDKLVAVAVPRRISR